LALGWICVVCRLIGRLRIARSAREPSSARWHATGASSPPSSRRLLDVSDDTVRRDLDELPSGADPARPRRRPVPPSSATPPKMPRQPGPAHRRKGADAQRAAVLLAEDRSSRSPAGRRCCDMPSCSTAPRAHGANTDPESRSAGRHAGWVAARRGRPGAGLADDRGPEALDAVRPRPADRCGAGRLQPRTPPPADDPLRRRGRVLRAQAACAERSWSRRGAQARLRPRRTSSLGRANVAQLVTDAARRRELAALRDLASRSCWHEAESAWRESRSSHPRRRGAGTWGARSRDPGPSRRRARDLAIRSPAGRGPPCWRIRGRRAASRHGRAYRAHGVAALGIALCARHHADPRAGRGPTFLSASPTAAWTCR